MSEQLVAFNVLQELAQKSLSNAQQLPAQIDTVQQWSGVGFSLMGYDFVISMEELTEMLEVPAYTRLLGVRSWVKGVANVRGRLLPLFDLASFFSGKLSGQKKHQRLLVVEDESIYAGLWVDNVFGMQHFDLDSRMEATAKDLPEPLEPFVDGSYNLNNKQWMVFSARKLLQDAAFLNVGSV